MTSSIRSRRIVVLILLAFGLTTPGISAPVRGGTLNLALNSDPPSLDPHRTPTVNVVHQLLYGTLVALDKATGEFTASLADSWTIAEGGKVLNFKLHPGVKFHDGTLLTPQAVKATLERLIDPAMAAPGAGFLGPIDRVETPDDSSVRLVFKQPYAPIFSSLRIPFLTVLSPTAMAKLGKDYGQTPIGAGPFKFRQWISGDRIILDRNPDYAWAPKFYQNRGAPHFDSIVLRIIPDESTRVIAFERGDLDILSVPAKEVRRLIRSGKYQVFQTPDDGGLYLGLNVTRPLFADVRVRRAVGFAINTDEVVRFALEGQAVAMDSPLAPTIWGYSKDVRKLAFRYDPERAKALLAEAGWRPGTDGVLQKDATRLVFTVWTYPRDTNVRIAVVVQNQLKKVGIQMNIEQIEPATLLSRTPKGEHDAILIGYSWPDADILYNFFHSSRLPTTNRVHYTNPEADRLLEEGRVTVDPQKRLQVYQRLQELLLRDAPWIPLASTVDVTMVQPWVHDVYVDKFGNLLLHDAYIRK